MGSPDAPAAYLRLSEAKKGTIGESETIDNQRATCYRYATNQGWSAPVAEYVDDDTKASIGSAPRPGFERMMADLESGKVDAIICRDTDRLQRDPQDLGRIINLLIRKQLLVLADNTVYDLYTTPSDMFRFQLQGSMAHYENAIKSKRMKEQAQGAAKRGRLYLRQRPFGWVDSQMSALHPVESEAIREGVAMLGQFGKYTLRDVADRWNAQGLRTPRTDKTWIASNVRMTLIRPAIAGIVTYKGEVLDVPPAFDFIVTREEYEQMRISMTANAKGGPRLPGSGSGISPVRGSAKCGRCQGNMARHNKSYRCAGYPNRCKGVYIKAHTLEGFIFSYVAGRIALMSSVAYEMDESLAQLKALTEELATIAAERTILAQSTVSMASKLALLEDLDARQGTADKKVRDLRSANALTGLVWELKPLGKNMSFEAHRENKGMVLERMKELSPTQLSTLCATFGTYHIRPAKNNVDTDRITVEELDPFGGYFDPFPLG